MRAGCFAERRVIDLFNRRFIPFYFNRSGHGEGGDEAASAFVAGQTDNPYAYLAAFSPDGKILGETELYADKDAVFEWAVELLGDHPEYATPSMGERKLRAGAEALEGNRLAVADLDEELGHYDDAMAAYRGLVESEDPVVARAAGSGLLRIERYRGRWREHAAIEDELRGRGKIDKALRFELDLERGRRLLAARDYATARPWLQSLTRRATEHPRQAEAHFYAGVACWFDGDRPWAKFHWCWVGERLKKDRLWRRAYIAAAAEGMPYANPELGGYKAPVGNIGVGEIIRAYDSAVRVYEGLLPLYEAGELSGPLVGPAEQAAPAWALAEGKAPKLVAKLRDGNAHIHANNPIVDQLVEIGAPALEPLVAAIDDRSFEGRGYAGWALGLVLASLDDRPAAALDALDRATKDTDSYVSVLSRSGKNQIRASVTKPAAGATAPEQLPSSAVLLVAGLVDGNAHLDANNARVEALVGLGDASIPTLLAAMGDEDFPGRGYAGWALSQVLGENSIEDEAALTALRAAGADSDSYVSVLARSGLGSLSRRERDKR